LGCIISLLFFCPLIQENNCYHSRINFDNLLGAISGIAHHPLQAIVHQNSSPLSGLVTGVGLGLVGVITKPLSGAAELVAMTGQGLLHGAGWSSLPQVCIISLLSIVDNILIIFFVQFNVSANNT
jgi:hypothetical protein